MVDGWIAEAAKESNIVDEKPIKIDVKALFEPIEKTAEKRGLKLGVYGEPSSGKTHFALTAPEPIYILDTEAGVSPLKSSFKGKKIFIMDVFQKGQNGERDEVECFEKIIQAIDWIYENVKEGTVVIDSGTDLWKFAQTYGKVKLFNLKPRDRLKYRFDWGAITNAYEQRIALLIHSPLNFIITGKIANKFDTAGQMTEEQQGRWQKDTSYQLDVVLMNRKTVNKESNIKFISEIDKCRMNVKLLNKEFTDLSFNKLTEELKK